MVFFARRNFGVFRNFRNFITFIYEIYFCKINEGLNANVFNLRLRQRIKDGIFL